MFTCKEDFIKAHGLEDLTTAEQDAIWNDYLSQPVFDHLY